MGGKFTTFAHSIFRVLPHMTFYSFVCWQFPAPVLNLFVASVSFFLLFLFAGSGKYASLRLTVFNVLLVYGLCVLYFYSIVDWYDPIGLPRYIGEIATYYGIASIYIYFVHRGVMHTLMGGFHKWHDGANANCAANLWCAHPFEALVLVAMAALSGHSIVRLFGWGSATSLGAWLSMLQFELMWIHSGIDFSLLPDACHHRFHHENCAGDSETNFGMSPVMDLIFRTYAARSILGNGSALPDYVFDHRDPPADSVTVGVVQERTLRDNLLFPKVPGSPSTATNHLPPIVPGKVSQSS